MCLWRELWYTVCGHYTLVLEPCKAAKKAQIKGTEMIRARSWSFTFFSKKDNNTTISEMMPMEKMTKITYTGDELILAPACKYTAPERVELVADLCPECIYTFELCKIDHAHAQQYVRDWRNQNNFGLEYGSLTFVEANGGLTIKKNPVDNYDSGSNEKFYTHRATKPTKQDRQDHERVSEETVARRTRRHDQENKEEAEKHARLVALYEKKLIFKIHNQETKENTIANTGNRDVLRPRRNSAVFRADPERDAADRQAYTWMPRGDCCPETFVNLEVEHEPEDPIQQERYIQDEAVRQIKKMAMEGDYSSASRDVEAYKKAQAAAVESKLKEKLKVKHIKEEAFRKQKERSVQQKATIFSNVDPRCCSGTNFNVSNSTFALNVIDRRPLVEVSRQSQSQWPQQRQGSLPNVTFENENSGPAVAHPLSRNRRPSETTPPQARSQWPEERRFIPNCIATYEVQRPERPQASTSVQSSCLQPQRANLALHLPVRPVPTPMRNNTVFPGAADFTYSKSSAKSARKSKHAAIDAYGDAYGPGSYDSTSSGEWAENDPEGIQLQKIALKASRRQCRENHAQNYGLQTERTYRDRNFSFSQGNSEVIRSPPAARLHWFPAPTQARRPGIHGLHTDPEVIAHSRSIFDRARQSSVARGRPAWMVDESVADYNVEVQSTSFGPYESQRTNLGSSKQIAVQNDSLVFDVGDVEENGASHTRVGATFHNEASLSGSPFQIVPSPNQISDSPVQLLQTPAPRGDSFSCPQHCSELAAYGVADDSLRAISRSPIQLLPTPARAEGRFSSQPKFADLDVYGAGTSNDSPFAYGNTGYCNSERPASSEIRLFCQPVYTNLDVYGPGIREDRSPDHKNIEDHDSHGSGRPTCDRGPLPPPKVGQFVMSPRGEESGRGKMRYKVV